MVDPFANGLQFVPAIPLKLVVVHINSPWLLPVFLAESQMRRTYSTGFEPGATSKVMGVSKSSEPPGYALPVSAGSLVTTEAFAGSVAIREPPRARTTLPRTDVVLVRKVFGFIKTMKPNGKIQSPRIFG